MSRDKYVTLDTKESSDEPEGKYLICCSCDKKLIIGDDYLMDTNSNEYCSELCVMDYNSIGSFTVEKEQFS